MNYLLHNEQFTNIQTAQAGLTKLLAKADKTNSYYRVMKNDKSLGVLIPDDMWKELLEDMEALSSPTFKGSIQKARKEQHYSLSETKRKLNVS